MKLVSDDILSDTGQENPLFDPVYPMIKGFKLYDPSAWTQGHPFELRRWRESAW